MALLLEVFAELFRSFGYAARMNAELVGRSGRTWTVPVVTQKDGRRVAVVTWLETQPLTEANVEGAIGLVQDTGCDGGLLLSLGAVPGPLASRAARDRVQIWDSKRITQELGTAVLHETCPGLWDHADPLLLPRPSRILDQIHDEARTTPAAIPPTPIPAGPPPMSASEPQAEQPFPAQLAPLLAQRPEDRTLGEFALPAAFGTLDAIVSQPVIAQPPIPMAAPTPPPVTPASDPNRRQILRLQVAKNLALSLVKNKLRQVDRVFLRLVPYYVFDYEAQLLVDGSLDAETKKGRISVDAALKRVQEWHQPLETGDLPREGVDMDEKKVRLTEAEARGLLVAELQNLVTRDVTMREDDNEWSVVVRKRVTLAEAEVRLTLQGLYWVPLWRITGKEGSMEIEASTGQVVFEELLEAQADAQLL